MNNIDKDKKGLSQDITQKLSLKPNKLKGFSNDLFAKKTSMNKKEILKKIQEIHNDDEDTTITETNAELEETKPVDTATDKVEIKQMVEELKVDTDDKQAEMTEGVSVDTQPTPIKNTFDETPKTDEEIVLEQDLNSEAQVEDRSQHEESIEEIVENADTVIYENSKELAGIHAEAKFVEATAKEKVTSLNKLAEAKEEIIANRLKSVEMINEMKIQANSEIFQEDKNVLNKEIDGISKESNIISTTFDNKIMESERRIDGLSHDKDALFDIRKNELDGMVRDAKARRRAELEKLKSEINVERQKMDAEIQRLREEIAEKRRIKEEEIAKRNAMLQERYNELNFLKEQENFIKQATIDNAKAEEERLKLIVESQQEQALMEFEKTITQRQVEILQENLDIKKELEMLNLTNEVEITHLKKVLAEKEGLSYKADSTIKTQEFELPSSLLIESESTQKEQAGIVVREFNKKIVKKFMATLQPEGVIPPKLQKQAPMLWSIFESYKQAIATETPVELRTIIKLASFITDLNITDEDILKEQTRVLCAIISGMTVQIGKGYIEKSLIPSTKDMSYYVYVETPSTYNQTDIYAHQNKGLWNVINDSITIKLESGSKVQIGKGLVLQLIDGVIVVLTSYNFWKEA